MIKVDYPSTPTIAMLYGISYFVWSKVGGTAVEHILLILLLYRFSLLSQAAIGARFVKGSDNVPYDFRLGVDMGLAVYAAYLFAPYNPYQSFLLSLSAITLIPLLAYNRKPVPAYQAKTRRTTKPPYARTATKRNSKRSKTKA